jgi:hypothetical protein
MVPFPLLNSSLDGKVSTGSGPEFTSIELSSSTPYIDFHYNKSSSDYTSRIIEYDYGLSIETNGLKIPKDTLVGQSKYYVAHSRDGHYFSFSWDGTYLYFYVDDQLVKQL